MTLAVVAALHDELRALQVHLEGARTEVRGGRTLHRGRLAGREAVLVLSGIGKVAAAATAALLIDRYAVTSILFTGVAGGLAPGVGVGDVVVADALLQHDLDASPLFPRWEVPLTGRSRFETDPARRKVLREAVQAVLAAPHPALASFGLASTRYHEGLVVSGDRFVSSSAESAALRKVLPQALAVEMEGAAMAQVCADFGCALSLLRTISDRADDAAHLDFPRFLREVAAEFSRDIVMTALARGFH